MSRTPGAVVLLLVIAAAAYGCVAILAALLFGLDLLPENGLAQIVAMLGSPWAALGGALLFWRRGPVWEEQLHGPFREGPGAARRRTMRSGVTRTPGPGQARRIALALAILGGLSLIVQYSGSAGALLPVAFVGGLVLAGRVVLSRAGSWTSWRDLLFLRTWWRRWREEAGAEAGADDPYREALRIFGLSDGYTKEELQARYRELHKRVHPDTGGSTAFAQQLNAAYDLLRKRRR